MRKNIAYKICKMKCSLRCLKSDISMWALFLWLVFHKNMNFHKDAQSSNNEWVGNKRLLYNFTRSVTVGALNIIPGPMTAINAIVGINYFAGCLLNTFITAR